MNNHEIKRNYQKVREVKWRMVERPCIQIISDKNHFVNIFFKFINLIL